MPRKRRFFLPNVPVHVVQRGLSREPVFFEAQDYATYAYWVGQAAQKYNLSVHAFVLMTNHIHLLMTPQCGQDVSRSMQFIGRRYVPYINHKYGRSGTLWESRFKSSLVCEDDYFFKVMRYIELNPVRANMCNKPGDYRWSSFCHNSGVKQISFITLHPLYKRLAASLVEQQNEYIELFRYELNKSDMENIRASWQSGTPLGSERFKKKVEERLSQKVGRARRGHPAKETKGG